MKRSEPYAGPFPRPRHSHRCLYCWEHRRQPSVYCYKAKCTLPHDLASCRCCASLQAPPVKKWAKILDDGNWVRVPGCDRCGHPSPVCTCSQAPPDPAPIARQTAAVEPAAPPEPTIPITEDPWAAARRLAQLSLF